MRLLPLLLITLAHLPLLIVYFQQLWDRPHYQFFPMVLLAFGYFVWHRWPARIPATRRARWLAPALVAFSAVLLTYAFVRLSPITAYLSFLLVVGAGLLRLGVPALGPWCLLLLLVRVPYGQDVALIQWMQRLTTDLSSTALDTIGIQHLTEGNVLMFPTTSLFVEEACSGVVSLLAIVACGGILAVWWRRSLVHSLLLVGTGILLAGAMNTVRVVVIAVGLDSYDVDLTVGWRHDLIGLCVFAISLLALFSIDRLLYFLLAPIKRSPLADYWDYAEGNVIVEFWNRYVGLESAELGEYELDDALPDSTAEPERGSTNPPGLGGLALDWALAAAFLMLGAGQVAAGIGPFSVAPDVSPTALKLTEESLPRQWGRWNRVGFEALERDSSSAFGEHSRIWAYENGSLSVRVSLDFVFPEWHALTACYAGVGWTVESRDRRPAEKGPPFIEASLTKPNGHIALLLFDLFDDEGRPYEAPAGSFVHPKLRRILSGAADRWNLPNYYQIQLLSVSDTEPISPAQREQVRELFEWFRQTMIERMEAGSPADTSSESSARQQPGTFDQESSLVRPVSSAWMSHESPKRQISL